MSCWIYHALLSFPKILATNSISLCQKFRCQQNCVASWGTLQFLLHEWAGAQQVLPLCFCPHLTGWHPEELFNLEKCSQYCLLLFILNRQVFLLRKEIRRSSLLKRKLINHRVPRRSCFLPNGRNYLSELFAVNCKDPWAHSSFQETVYPPPCHGNLSWLFCWVKALDTAVSYFKPLAFPFGLFLSSLPSKSHPFFSLCSNIPLSLRPGKASCVHFSPLTFALCYLFIPLVFVEQSLGFGGRPWFRSWFCVSLCEDAGQISWFLWSSISSFIK